MSIASAFNNATSGLAASARAVQVVSSNIANALTEGYAARRLDLGSATLGGGVRVLGTTRLTDPVLQGLTRDAAASASAGAARNIFWQRVEGALGLPGQGLSQALSAFDSALISASDRPDLESRLATVADRATALAAQLEQTRNDLAQAKAARVQKVAELNNELTQMQQTLAPGHPSVIALKQTIAATDKDTPQIIALKEKERRLVEEIAAKKKAKAAAAAAAAPKPGVPRPAVAPAPAPTVAVGGSKSLQDAEVQFNAATKKYAELVTALDALKLEMEMAKTGFEKKYKVTQPAEVPAGPKRPVAVIAVLIGIMATFMAILAVASLADRFSGLFFEPRDVRDKLGIPVYATFS